jgi:hypothetical protein
LIYGEESKLSIREIIASYSSRFGDGFGRSKTNDLLRLSNYELADIDINKLTTKDLIDHCTRRNTQAKPQTVSGDLSSA